MEASPWLMQGHVPHSRLRSDAVQKGVKEIQATQDIRCGWRLGLTADSFVAQFREFLVSPHTGGVLEGVTRQLSLPQGARINLGFLHSDESTDWKEAWASSAVRPLEVRAAWSPLP